MKHKKANRKKPHGSTPGFDRKGVGIEIQTWGLAADHSLVYAGVHFVPEVAPRYLYKLHHNWLRWRRWYDNLPEHRDEDYPAKHCPPVVFVGAHPIANPETVKWLRVAPN